MIVKINDSNAHLYNALFAKAYQALEKAKALKEGLLSDAEKADKRFHSLNHYLGHVEELLQIDAAYLLLPLDEPAFNVDADSRAVKASKIAILQNDHNSETVQFIVDRYVDFQDLKEAEIYVQWTLPSGKEGATRADEARDFSIPGKIRFGWPLTSDVTSEAGIVKYSVRFWNREKNNNNKDEVVYSLNTLTSSLTISPSLQPVLNSEVDVVAPVKSGFARTIRNSQMENEGMDLPLAPYFYAPGLDLPATASLVNDTLTLSAQACVGDTGALAYTWYYKPAVSVEATVGSKTVNFNNETFYPYEDVKKGDKVVTYGFNHLKTGTPIQSYVEAIIKNKKLNIGDRYFVSDGNGGYKAYTGTTPPENEKLYELVTEYMITAGDDEGFPKVTGQYKVCATNSLGNNTTEEMPSTVCQLVSPDNVVITTDLADKLVLSETVSQNVLKVATKKQTYNIEPVYAWYKNTKSASKEGASLIAGATSANYTPTEPGWYMVNCSVDLNREPKDADSKICKVTNKATLPDVDYGTEAKKYLETYDGNVKIPTYMDGKDAILDLAVSKYAPDANHAEELYSDGLTYEWHVKIGEHGADRPVKEGDTFLKGGLGTPTLQVYSPAGSDVKYHFRCLITNTVNGSTVTTQLADAKSFYVF